MLSAPIWVDPRYFIRVTIQGQDFQALIDTGATQSFINTAMRQKFQQIRVPVRYQRNTIHLANGHAIDTREYYNTTFYFGEKPITLEVAYMKELVEDAIFGIDFLKKTDFKMIMAGQVLTNQEVSRPGEADAVWAL